MCIVRIRKRHELPSHSKGVNARNLFKRVDAFDDLLIEMPCTQLLAFMTKDEPPISKFQVDKISLHFEKTGSNHNLDLIVNLPFSLVDYIIIILYEFPACFGIFRNFFQDNLFVNGRIVRTNHHGSKQKNRRLWPISEVLCQLHLL